MINSQQKALKIGYLMQADSVQMSTISGPQLHVKAVVQGLKQRGHQVRLVAIQNGQIQWTDDTVNWYPTEFGYSESRSFRRIESVLRGIQSRLHLPFLRLFDSYRFSDACVAALAGYDILYERYGILSYGGLIAARRLGIPLIFEINGDLLEEYVQLGLQLSRPQWAILHLATRVMYNKAARLVPVSEILEQGIVQRWGIDPKKVNVIPNGADIDKFIYANGATGTQLRHQIGDGPVIIFVGSFEPWHGVDLLLDAFASLVSSKPEARLVLVGDGRLRSEMESRVASLDLRDRVIFTGMIDHSEVASLLKTADIAVIYHRGTKAETALSPLKLFEYMAAGKAIVAPAVSNIERLLTHRVTGLLIPPGNPEALANALVELLENEQLRSTLGKAARQQAIDKHSWTRTISELEVIMYELVDGRRC